MPKTTKPKIQIYWMIFKNQSEFEQIVQVRVSTKLVMSWQVAVKGGPFSRTPSDQC